MTSPIQPYETGELEVADRVRAERLELLYAQSVLAMLLSVVVAAMLCILLWKVTDHRLLIGWWLALVATALVRLVLAWRFQRRAAGDFSRAWERWFVISVVTVGAVWGFGGLLILPAQAPTQQLAVFFFLIGVAGGALASYSAHATAVSLSVILLVGPVTLWFAVQDDLMRKIMALGAALFLGAALRATRRLSEFLRRSARLSLELDAARSIAERLAATDELTDLRNRRSFYELGEHTLATAKRYGQAASLVLFDIDHFKSINDTYGHATGDDVLRALADAIRSAVRTSDVAARLGGEEFAILLPATTGPDAEVLADRLRQLVESTKVLHRDNEVRFTISLGVAECSPYGDTLDEVIADADAALYEAKRTGRNRVKRRAAGRRSGGRASGARRTGEQRRAFTGGQHPAVA